MSEEIMKVEFQRGISYIEPCCDEMEEATLEQFIEPENFRVCIVKLIELDDGVWDTEPMDIYFCPFCGTKIDKTIKPPKVNIDLEAVKSDTSLN